MKVFNIIRNILVVLSFVSAGVAFLIGGITLDPADVAFSSAALSFIVVVSVGFFLFFTTNNITKKIGLGLSTACMLGLAYYALKTLGEAPTSSIVSLVAVILYVLYFGVNLLGYLILGNNCENEPDKDPKIKAVLKWRKMVEEGIISKEEFEATRQEVLYGKAANKK